MSPGKTKQMLLQSIKEARKLRGWTQEETARRCDIPFSTYRNFERLGQGSFDNFHRIVCTLGDRQAFEHLFPKPKYQSIEDVLD